MSVLRFGINIPIEENSEYAKYIMDGERAVLRVMLFVRENKESLLNHIVSYRRRCRAPKNSVRRFFSLRCPCGFEEEFKLLGLWIKFSEIRIIVKALLFGQQVSLGCSAPTPVASARRIPADDVWPAANPLEMLNDRHTKAASFRNAMQSAIAELEKLAQGEMCPREASCNWTLAKLRDFSPKIYCNAVFASAYRRFIEKFGLPSGYCELPEVESDGACRNAIGISFIRSMAMRKGG